ncbi:MAG: CHAD domain-containing protein [Armatimonadota bacterium]
MSGKRKNGKPHNKKHEKKLRQRKRLPEISANAGSQPDGNCAVSIRKVARKTFVAHGRALVSHLQGVRNGKDIEAIHQTRVATRRLRAAFDIFGFCYDRTHTKLIKREVKQVTGALGQARDLDVVLDFLVAYRDAAPSEEHEALDELVASKKKQRKALNTDLRRTVKAIRDRRIVKRLEHYARTAQNGPAIKARKPEEIDLPSSDSPLPMFAFPLLMPRLETVLSWLPEVRATGEPHALHSMRIDAKGLRYAMEPFLPAFGEEYASLLGDVKRIQEILGDIHDFDVWAEMIKVFAECCRSEKEPLHKLVGHLQSRRAGRYVEFKAWWSPGAELKFRRSFVNAIAPSKEEPTDTPVEGTGS